MRIPGPGGPISADPFSGRACWVRTRSMPPSHHATQPPGTMPPHINQATQQPPVTMPPHINKATKQPSNKATKEPSNQKHQVPGSSSRQQAAATFSSKAPKTHTPYSMHHTENSFSRARPSGLLTPFPLVWLKPLKCPIYIIIIM